jgi:hypothetical protein
LKLTLDFFYNTFPLDMVKDICILNGISFEELQKEMESISPELDWDDFDELDEFGMDD